MKNTRINIKNNINLNFISTDRFKMSRISISFICDADRIESPKKKLMFSTLMRGSKNYPTVSHINRALDDLYGTNVSFRCATDGDRHVYKFVCEMLDERYMYPDDKVDIIHGTFKILKDILMNPKTDNNGLLSESYIDSEKLLACDAIRAKANDLRSYSMDKCKGIMFKDEKCGISVDGDEDIVAAFTPADLTECYKNIFKDCKIECFYIGSKSQSEVVDYFNYLFSDIECCGAVTYGYDAFCSDSEVKEITEVKHVSQGRLNIGLRCGVVMSDKEYYAMSLFNEIFGGSSISKLFMNVREKKSLCYYCSSVYMLSKGVIFIACGIKPENKKLAYDEIIYQLEQMKNGNFSDTDIITAKKLLSNPLVQVNDSPAGLDSYYFRRNMAGISLTPQESIDMINSVTKEDIVNMSARIFLDTVFFLDGDNIGGDVDNE